MGVEAVLASQDVGAVKTGALGNGAVVERIAELATVRAFPPLVVDPVFASTSGGILLDDDGIGRLRETLLPAATLVTPNLSEASILAGRVVRDSKSMIMAGERILRSGCEAVLIKGGHLEGDRLTDVLVCRDTEPVLLEGSRLEGGDVRGTGCALATLIAGFIASGCDTERAIREARSVLREAIEGSVCLGSGPRVLAFEG